MHSIFATADRPFGEKNLLLSAVRFEPWLLTEFEHGADRELPRPSRPEQVMSAQPVPLRMVNGVGSSAPEPRGERAHGDEGQSAGGDARTRTADEVATGTEPGSVEERGVAPQQSRDVTLTPPDTSVGTTTRQRARQDAFLEIADVGSARAAGIEPRSVENASSYQGFMTPRLARLGLREQPGLLAWKCQGG